MALQQLKKRAQADVRLIDQALAASSVAPVTPNSVGVQTKKGNALVVGINYEGTAGALKGCVADAHAMTAMLRGLGYDVVEITDDGPVRPTAANIMLALRRLAMRSRQGDVWFHFSGHGSWRVDTNRDERDRRDESIVCLDRHITDDELYRTIVIRIPPTGRLICTMDCCHSGTAMDLRYRYISGNRAYTENPRSRPRGEILCLSGCRDAGTSADALINNKWSGAMTTSFIDVFRESGNAITAYTLLRKLRVLLARRGFKQKPQLTTSRRLNGLSKFFG